MKQIRIEIPEDLHKSAKLAALESGMTLAAFIALAISEETQKVSSTPRRPSAESR